MALPSPSRPGCSPSDLPAKASDRCDGSCPSDAALRSIRRTPERGPRTERRSDCCEANQGLPAFLSSTNGIFNDIRRPTRFRNTIRGRGKRHESNECFRYVSWIGARGLSGPRSAPPLRMRLRCWYEIVVETTKRKRVVLREEGLRGDDTRTAARAIDRWRRAGAQPGNEPVAVREVRVAKSQPRPMAPRETSRAVRTGAIR